MRVLVAIKFILDILKMSIFYFIENEYTKKSASGASKHNAVSNVCNYFLQIAIVRYVQHAVYIPF